MRIDEALILCIGPVLEGLSHKVNGLMKNWIFEQRFNLQFRWEMFNAFNHPNFANPNTSPSSGNFGQITTIGPVAPRVQQAALKLTF